MVVVRFSCKGLNERAVRVIHRVHNKLTGREFGEELTVSQQVINHKFPETLSIDNVCTVSHRFLCVGPMLDRTGHLTSKFVPMFCWLVSFLVKISLLGGRQSILGRLHD